MFLDLNKFFAKENNSTVKSTFSKSSSSEKNVKSTFPKYDINKKKRQEHQNQLKIIDDNPLDVHMNRLYRHEVQNLHSKKDAFSFPVVDLGALDWDYEETNKPINHWSENMIREAIGKEKENWHKINSRNDHITSTSTTMASITIKLISPKSTPTPFYKFDLMKVNPHYLKNSSSEESTSNDLWVEINNKKFEASTSAPQPLTTTSYKILTTPRKEKKKGIHILRRRKFKKNFWIPSKSEHSNKEVGIDDHKKIRNPLEDDWNRIFRSTTLMSISDFSDAETTTLSVKSSENFRKTGKEDPLDKNTGFLKRMVSKFCNIENTLGILQLCNSKSLSKRRKIRKNISRNNVFHRNKQNYPSMSKGYYHHRKEIDQQEFSFMKTVSNVFSFILPS